MVIVRVQHVNYNGTFKADKYWFKSNDDLKCNDYVYCDTQFGCVKGIVCDVYKNIYELIKAKVVVDFSNLKECCKEVTNFETKEEMQELKALKLLKEKGLGVEVLTEKLKTGERFEHFHITFQCNCLETITKEEYELLEDILYSRIKSWMK